jgi:hypothetical protein
LGSPIALQRVGLPAGSVPGQHQVRPQALAERVLHSHSLEIGQRLLVLPNGEAGAELLLERGQPEFLEAGDLPGERLGICQVAQRRPAPQLERLADPRGGFPRLNGKLPACPTQQLFKPERVELVCLGVQDVPRGPPLDPVGAERASQMRNVALDRVPGCRRRIVAPNPLEEVLHRHDAVRREKQVCEHQALTGSAKRHRASVGGDLQRPEESELEPTGERIGDSRRLAGRQRMRDAQQLNRVGHPLEPNRTPSFERYAVQGTGEVRELACDEDLSRPGACAETGGQVQRTAAESVADGNHFADVDPHPDRERHVGCPFHTERRL